MKPRVLVVEDRDYLRQVVVALLEEAGYAAAGAATATAALAGLPAWAPDVIVLDMELPGMNGREFLERLRATPRWAGTPVLIVSGYGENLPPSPDRPGLAVLAKPFDPPQLLDAVARMLVT
ncbi:MAG TPA: response regulator [Candidatus Binatia bacterium]|nr:response regulator [Candidatus Binatia bacterium]